MKLTRNKVITIGVLLSGALKLHSILYGPADPSYRAMLVVGILILLVIAWTLLRGDTNKQ